MRLSFILDQNRTSCPFRFVFINDDAMCNSMSFINNREYKYSDKAAKS